MVATFDFGLGEESIGLQKNSSLTHNLSKAMVNLRQVGSLPFVQHDV
jgi:hypothetical protein